MRDMNFNLSVTISPKDKSSVRKLKLRAVFHNNKNDYGNGFYLAIKGREGTDFERMFDIRYEQFNPANPEPFLASWVYNNWSGEKGSWDVVSLKIEDATLPRPKSKPMKSLPSDVIS